MPSLELVVADTETFWSQDHSLTKMSPIAYINHPDTEVISVAVKFGNYPTDVLFGEDNIRSALSKIDWSNKILVFHNAEGFDAPLWAWRFGIRPAMWLCTMAMARPLHAKTTGLSLAKLVAHYAPQLEAMGISGVKDSTALVNTKGRHLKDFTEAEIDAMRIYNRTDTEQCAGLFKILAKHTTPAELRLIDLTIRMLVEPQFQVDRELLEAALVRERAAKRENLRKVIQHFSNDAWESLELDADNAEEAVRALLASSAKFSEFLKSQGVPVPLKTSKTTGKPTAALAKTDEEFLALQEHSNELVAAAARARLGVKSTQLETRIGAFLAASASVGGKLPVPLKYYGADTTGRWSGWAYNCFTGDVEVLTREGWMRFDAWGGQPIMQWWPDGRLSYEESPGVLVKPYTGEVIDVKSRCVDVTVTPDHRFVSVPNNKRGGLRERTAAWIADHAGLNSVPVSGLWSGGSSEMTPEQVRLAVAFSADGCVVDQNIQVGLRRARKIERMKLLLDQAGVPYRTRSYPPQERHTGGHDTITYVVPNPPVSKGFGPWILSLSREALDAFVEELRHWDGQSHHKSGNLCFWTSDVEQAGWVQTALALSGTASTVRVYPSDKGHAPKVLVYARSEKYTSINTARDVTRSKFDGVVYCASVESSYILVRRNNRVSVVGQCQNLPRISGKNADALRNSLRAPDGFKVVVADLSGIELRVNMFLWKVPYAVQLFQASPDKADLYRYFAANELYMIPEDEVTKAQRQIGKVSHLGLGFGAAGATFQKVAKLMGGVDMSLDEANTVVRTYRTAHPEIVTGWKTCHTSLDLILTGQYGVEIDPWGLCTTVDGGIKTPRGMIRYPALRRERNEEGKLEYFYGEGRHKARIYAGKIDENLVQHLARCVIADNMLTIARSKLMRDYPPALTVHDELVYVVPEGMAEEALDYVQSVMRTPPEWWPELVVHSEGDIADTYGAAK